MSPEPHATLHTAELPVTEVLLTEDRGQVTRAGALSWGGGPVTFTVPGLSPVIVDSSLRVKVQGATLVRAAVRRRWVPIARPTETDADALAREAQRAADRLVELDRAVKRLDAHSKGLTAELHRYAAAVTRNAGLGLFDAARLDADVARLRERLLSTVPRARALAEEGEEANRQHDAVRALISALESGKVRLETVIELALDAPHPAEATAELRYLLPNALWRPTYTAELRTDGALQVAWGVEACVWQRTGEDWRGAQVVLSTARPSAGATLPPLHEDHLRMRPKTAEERRTVAADFRDQTLSAADLTDGGGPEALPGVDDGGETRVLRGDGPCDLPSDGRPHRVSVSGFRAPATSRWLCYPERALSVFREVKLQNLGAEPLMAGPVVLLVDGAYVGVGEVPFVAAGERFAVSFGSNDDLVVRYERSRKVEKRVVQSDLVWFVAEATLHHTGVAPVEVEVVMRCPVSELEKVVVHRSPALTTGGAEGPDPSGHMRWILRLKPGGRAEANLGFRLEVGGGVNLPDPW